MKSFLIFLFIGLLYLSVVSAECIEGIDDVCDPACVDVDFDCIANEAGHNQDFFCVSAEDGYCDMNCYDVDYDCIYVQQQTLIRSAVTSLPEDESLSFIASFEETTPSALELLLLGAGFLFFAVGLVWVLKHLKEKQQRPQYNSLIPYGQAALENGYSLAQIKESLLSQGYTPEFIKGYLRALEHRP